MRRTTRLVSSTVIAGAVVLLPAAPALAQAVTDDYSGVEVLDTSLDAVRGQQSTSAGAGTGAGTGASQVSPRTLPFTGGEIAAAGVLGASALALGASFVVMGRRKHVDA